MVIGGDAVRPAILREGDRIEQVPHPAPGRTEPVQRDRARAWGRDAGRLLAGRGTGGAGSTRLDAASGAAFMETAGELDRGAVPAAVLNAGPAAHRAFLAGLLEAGGALSGRVEAGPDGHCLLHGITYIMERLGIPYRVTRKEGSDIMQVRPADGRRAQPATILEIRPGNARGYVYDIETANHHFCGGIGNVLLHNTDSVFLKDPSSEQIRAVVETAKVDHGVELEVDKEYRYCVLSNRKKNYFGVTKAGKVDIKGLTGKKSHTPPFIKSLFEEIVAILSEVHNTEEFERAKTAISERISDRGKQLNDRKVPLDKLAFRMTMGKSTDEYTKSIPQHVRAAKMLESNGGDMKKRGDIISFVKTSTQPGVKPVSMANPGQIDTSKYIDFMESTLNQIVSSMDLDFDVIMGKGKQTDITEFFWG